MTDASRPSSTTRAPIADSDWVSLHHAFAFAWAFQALEEKSDRLDPSAWVSLDGASDVAVVVCAIALLCRPGSLRLLLALSVSSLLNVAVELPHIMNHLVLAACLNAAIVIELGRRALATGLPTGDDAIAAKARLMRSVSPLAQMAIVLLYAFAFFHKLNWDFVDLEASCVAYSYHQAQMILGLLPSLTPALLIVGIGFTYAVEGLLPILLLIPRTRYAALLVGIVFHLLLGSYVPSFTILLFSLYLFFLPPALLSAMTERMAALPGIGASARTLASVIALTTAATWYGLFYLPPFPHVHYMRWIWLLVGGASALAFVALARVVAGPARTFPSARPNSLVGWLLCAVIVVNGLGPYIGFKTAVAFAMYSNLRTEGVTNHMLLPKGALQWIDVQDDLIEIVDSDHPAFEMDRQLLLPRFEVRRRLQEQSSPVAITIRDGDAVVHSADLRQNPTYATPIAWPLAKLMIFRPVPPSGGDRCFW